MSIPQPCRIPGCNESDTSPLRLCTGHFLSLPAGLRRELTGALAKARGLGQSMRGQILAPVIEKAVSHIEAAQTSTSLFGEDA